MTVVQDVFDAFSLDRMIMEFAWTITVHEKEENDKSNFVYQKYQDIFLNPKFIINNNGNSNFTQIDIRKLHQNYSKSIPRTVEGHIPPKSNPKSLDYQDNRLFSTPSDVHKHILDIKKLDHKCFVNLKENKALFDCNFEQLTLIMRILEGSLQFYPLIQKQNQFNFSSQSIIPKFNTHSYSFSFEFSKSMSQLFDGADTEILLLDLLMKMTNTGNVILNDIYQLSGFEGIFVSIKKSDFTNHMIIQYDVTEIFTKTKMLLDRSSIQKTSLWFFNEFLKGLINNNQTNSELLTKLMDDLSEYIA